MIQVNLFQKHLFLHQLKCCVHKLFWMSKQNKKIVYTTCSWIVLSLQVSCTEFIIQWKFCRHIVGWLMSFWQRFTCNYRLNLSYLVHSTISERDKGTRTSKIKIYRTFKDSSPSKVAACRPTYNGIKLFLNSHFDYLTFYKMFVESENRSRAKTAEWK